MSAQDNNTSTTPAAGAASNGASGNGPANTGNTGNTGNNGNNGNGKGNGQRKKGLALIAAAVIIAGIGYGGYQWLVSSRYEETDNAYVQANVVQITPLVGGTVRAVYADDTDYVKAGQKLVSLDPADARVALEQAQAQLAQTVREVRTLFANNSSLAAQVQVRQAEQQRAQSEMARLQADLARRQPLLATGAVSKEELDHTQAQLTAARAAYTAAQSAMLAAQEQLQSNQALTDGVDVEQHPNVQRAAARFRESFLAFQRADLVAPVDGWVARRSVQLGQRVAAGSPVMAVVGLQQVWVDANFKESQLAKLRIGQSVTLKADVYGKKTEYHGTVQGMGAGTGAAFALLPAQNATGNWIKVVQRVPVRIALDPKEVAEHPLRVGLSMDVQVDIRNQDGATLTQGQRQAPALQTTIFDAQERAADEKVNQIIAANLGKKAVKSGSTANAARGAKAAAATSAKSNGAHA
ncbi:HlyD family efflux transporter periplasmic adaptor subunit [Roseateles terrae]|uniref:Membrane fusion protein (Multidrug efflux system) n=1 Tax=Roseateles terrae TaxID=431060 RepID=A0ABR6GLQ1_9BURK|nr:HlyD family efflux transporter periplasmic adaptor subunit [Roseateles terrae]MBB3193037.1 membrane fusion protein (multidrug efflux system) [Roseateles terrae]OWQ89723.1 EmrA/EmrK family multidrug efflux transporter periplasmic adaptor subunit [Roseateles terrae]